MKAFAQLYADVDATNKTSRKLDALARYFAPMPAADAAWAVFFLSGRKLKRLLPSARLRDWGAGTAGVPGWLFDESYHAVGDFSETVSLLLPRNDVGTDLPLHHWVEENLLHIQVASEAEQKRLLLDAWLRIDRAQRFVWNKLITGEFRVGVSQRMVVLALAQAAGLNRLVIAHRLMGDWQPTAEFFGSLLDPETQAVQESQPYPFFLVHALEDEAATLGDIADWQAEWKWDGIRASSFAAPAISISGRVARISSPIVIRRSSPTPAGSRMASCSTAKSSAGWMVVRCRSATCSDALAARTSASDILREVPATFLAFDLLEQDGVDLLRIAAGRASAPAGSTRRVGHRFAACTSCGRVVVGGTGDASPGKPRARGSKASC